MMKYLGTKYPEKSLNPPSKHFIFGQLVFETENALTSYGIHEDRRQVVWRYHVANAIKLKGDNSLYIMDPAVSSRPVPKSEFHAIFTNFRNVQTGMQGAINGFVTCHPLTYSVDDDCFHPSSDPVDEDVTEFYLNK